MTSASQARSDLNRHMAELRAQPLPVRAKERSLGWTACYAVRPFALIAFAIAAAHWLGPVVAVSGAFLLLLAAQRAFQTLVHDASHDFYSAERARNDRLANWLAAGWIGMEVSAYRKVHMQHHTHNGSALDPEHTSMAKVRAEGGMAQMIARYVLGLEALRLVRKYFFQPRAGTKQANGRMARAIGLTPIAAAQLLLLAAMTAAGAWWLYGLWLYLALTWNPMLSRLRFLAEHPGEADATVTTRAWWLERVFFAPHNFNYHCEHHGWPTVQPYRLPLVHRHLRDTVRFFDAHPRLVATSFVGTLGQALNEGASPDGGKVLQK